MSVRAPARPTQQASLATAPSHSVVTLGCLWRPPCLDTSATHGASACAHASQCAAGNRRVGCIETSCLVKVIALFSPFPQLGSDLGSNALMGNLQLGRQWLSTCAWVAGVLKLAAGHAPEPTSLCWQSWQGCRP